MKQSALDLLSLADWYQLIELKASLEQGLYSHHLMISTVLQFLFYAEACNCGLLLEKCKNFIECNTFGILSSKVILTLPYAYLKSFIARDYLLINEIEVFKAIQKWIVHNNPEPPERRKLLKCVRLPQISSKELSEEVAASGLLMLLQLAKRLKFNKYISNVFATCSSIFFSNNCMAAF